MITTDPNIMPNLSTFLDGTELTDEEFNQRRSQRHERIRQSQLRTNGIRQQIFALRETNESSEPEREELLSENSRVQHVANEMFRNVLIGGAICGYAALAGLIAFCVFGAKVAIITALFLSAIGFVLSQIYNLN